MEVIEVKVMLSHDLFSCTVHLSPFCLHFLETGSPRPRCLAVDNRTTLINTEIVVKWTGSQMSRQTAGGQAMRILPVLVVAVALVLQTALVWPAEPGGGQDQGIQWVTNFDEALARAKAEKKPVYLDFFNPN